MGVEGLLLDSSLDHVRDLLGHHAGNLEKERK